MDGITDVRDHCPRCGFLLKPQRDRSIDQNRLQFMWFNEIAKQWPGHTIVDVRRHCKLTFGIPIRCAEASYSKHWDSIEARHSYVERLELMDIWPVTQDMTTGEMKQYLDMVNRWAGEQGWEITQPEGKWWDAA